MHCSEPGHRAVVASAAPRGPGRSAWGVGRLTLYENRTESFLLLSNDRARFRLCNNAAH
jgi:hypothetical protein